MNPSSSNLLFVAATPLETAHLRAQIEMKAVGQAWFEAELQGRKITLLHTGIGMVNTAYVLGDYLAHERPDLAVHFGIAGSYDRGLALGQVVEVVEDTFAELGASSPEGWLDLETMGFSQFEQAGQAFYNTFINPLPSPASLPKVTGLTSNQVHGTAEAIAAVQSRYDKQLETMESAAFFACMLRNEIPFHAFRAISNYVTPRDKSQWKLKLAVENMQDWLLQNYVLID